MYLKCTVILTETIRTKSFFDFSVKTIFITTNNEFLNNIAKIHVFGFWYIFNFVSGFLFYYIRIGTIVDYYLLVYWNEPIVPYVLFVYWK